MDGAVSVPDAPAPDAPVDAGCSCSVAPPPRCLDAQTLESSRAPGTCIGGGACVFDTFTSRCPFGCAAGACQPLACTPTCGAQVCADDGCGGACGPCSIDTTYPGATVTQLGIARDLRVAPDGIHVVTLRALDPRCPRTAIDTGRLDVWTVPATGAASHRTIALHAPLFPVAFTADGHLVYTDSADPCNATTELWVAQADGRDPVLLATDVLGEVTVAGSWVYFVAPDPDAPAQQPGTLLIRARLPGGALERVTTLPTGSDHAVSPTGDAVWVSRTRPEANLIVFRADGTFEPLIAAPLEPAGTPQWSPDGKRLTYAWFDRRISKTPLHVVTLATGASDMLDEDCRCTGFVGITFSDDSARVAWLTAQPGGLGVGLDALIHRFSGGADVRLTDVVAPDLGGSVDRLSFSVDGSRLYALIGSVSPTRLMTGRVDASATAVSLGPVSGDDRRAWDETADGAVIAINSGTATSVVTYGGGAHTITGSNFERPRFEHTAAGPRLLVQQDLSLSVFPTSGAGPGVAIPGFDWTDQLSIWVSAGQVPFAFGWVGPVVLFPSAVMGSSAFVVVQDLMAWTPAASGRLAARVIRYRIADAPARIFGITQDQALFVLPRP
jgi:hypothetical protein